MKNLISSQAMTALSKINPLREQAIDLVSKHYFQLATYQMSDDEGDKVLKQAKEKALYEARGWKMFKLIPYINEMK